MSASLPKAAGTILIIGASRGIGQAMATQFVAKGWHVYGTVRSNVRSDLHALADDHVGQVSVETLDINDPDQISALRNRLAGTTLDILFVNAGTTTYDEHVHIGRVSTEEFTRVMVTNALGPMRAIEALQDLVPAGGLIGVMSSGQGSISNNEKGMREVYRGSKAALNMFMRSFAAREPKPGRAMVLMAPGWIRTALGGPDAPLTVEEAVPKVVDVLLCQRGKSGLRFLDREGSIVPW